MLDREMPLSIIEAWLREDNDKELERLWEEADYVRKETVGNEVHLRGLIEISNFCARKCAYCGINANNRSVERYRMSEQEIFDCVAKAVALGYGTVVLQAGEDFGIGREWMAEVIREIKMTTDLAVTLSLGERSRMDFREWRLAGADRYLLRFETSDSDLFTLIHPSLPGKPTDRIRDLYVLKDLGYEIGSGVMVGIPGQSWSMLANDLALFRELDLDMIGLGPYIEHPATLLAKIRPQLLRKDHQQVPGSELAVYKVLALTRIMAPEANIPSTTALGTLDKKNGRELGLMRGANVIMPNITPSEYRERYEIYPDKANWSETAGGSSEWIEEKLKNMNRSLGKGVGSRVRRQPV